MNKQISCCYKELDKALISEVYVRTTWNLGLLFFRVHRVSVHARTFWSAHYCEFATFLLDRWVSWMHHPVRLDNDTCKRLDNDNWSWNRGGGCIFDASCFLKWSASKETTSPTFRGLPESNKIVRYCFSFLLPNPCSRRSSWSRASHHFNSYLALFILVSDVRCQSTIYVNYCTVSQIRLAYKNMPSFL
jgi:hypothetical protein